MEKRAVVDPDFTPSLKEVNKQLEKETLEDLDNDFTKEAAETVKKQLGKGEAYDEFNAVE